MLYFARIFILANPSTFFLMPCPQLISSRRRPAWSKETDRRITKLIRFTFDTGVLFSAMAFLDLAAYLHMSYLHVSMYAYCVLDRFRGC
jgi:hypothetical protein